MHTYEEYRQILELWEQGKKKKRIAIITGINRATVRECIVRYESVAGLIAYKELHPDIPHNVRILRAGDDIRQEDLFKAYSYLLGVYLGDGNITPQPRTYKLRIACDTHYPNLIEEMKRAISVITPFNVVNTVPNQGNCLEIYCHNNFWPDLFPQHGKGPKHRRPIILQEWQSRIVSKYPREFVKGLLHTDGSRTNNVVKGKNYPRYEFCNYSADIRKLFSDTCDLLGLHWTPSSNGILVQIARRADVAFLDQFIGPKS